MPSPNIYGWMYCDSTFSMCIHVYMFLWLFAFLFKDCSIKNTYHSQDYKGFSGHCLWPEKWLLQTRKATILLFVAHTNVIVPLVN